MDTIDKLIAAEALPRDEPPESAIARGWRLTGLRLARDIMARTKTAPVTEAKGAEGAADGRLHR